MTTQEVFSRSIGNESMDPAEDPMIFGFFDFLREEEKCQTVIYTHLIS